MVTSSGRFSSRRERVSEARMSMRSGATWRGALAAAGRHASIRQRGKRHCQRLVNVPRIALDGRGERNLTPASPKKLGLGVVAGAVPVDDDNGLVADDPGI